MTELTILEAVKKDQRISTTQFDDVIPEIIAAAKRDLTTGGVKLINENDPLVRQAIKFYARANFRNGDSKDRELNYDRYERLKKQLGSCGLYRGDTGSTTAGENEGGGAP